MITNIPVTGLDFKVHVTFTHQTPTMTGIIRWNGMCQQLEVMDGDFWSPLISDHVSIRLDSETENVINWAKMKMDEENQLKNLLEKYPQLNEMYNRFELMKTLLIDHHIL